MVATSSTTKRTSERTPLLMQQLIPAVDHYARPIVDAMPLPVKASQCATTQVSVVSFAAKDLRENDREGHVICSNCEAPSQPNQPRDEEHEGEQQGQEHPQEQELQQSQERQSERRLSWRCWNCNMLHHRHDHQKQQQQPQGQLSASRFCALQ